MMRTKGPVSLKNVEKNRAPGGLLLSPIHEAYHDSWVQETLRETLQNRSTIPKGEIVQKENSIHPHEEHQSSNLRESAAEPQ